MPSLTTGNFTFNMATLVSNPSGAALTYTIATSPHSNASTSGSTLNVSANYRSTSYSVTINVSNLYGSASMTVNVSEIAIPTESINAYVETNSPVLSSAYGINNGLAWYAIAQYNTVELMAKMRAARYFTVNGISYNYVFETSSANLPQMKIVVLNRAFNENSYAWHTFTFYF